MFEPGLSIYHLKGLNILKKISQTGVEMVLDDMSNLTRRITMDNGISIRLNHSLLYCRNPTGHKPVLIAEFISGNWKSGTFGVNFKRFWNCLDRYYGIPSQACIGTDWYSGYRTELNQVANLMTNKEYCISGVNVAAGIAPVRQIKLRIWSCMGHASKNISKKYDNPSLKQFTLMSWKLIYRSQTFEEFVEYVSFIHALCNDEINGLSSYNWKKLDVRKMIHDSATDECMQESYDQKPTDYEAIANDADNEYMFDRSKRNVYSIDIPNMIIRKHDNVSSSVRNDIPGLECLSGICNNPFKSVSVPP